jgi:hypothetical protein
MHLRPARVRASSYAEPLMSALVILDRSGHSYLVVDVRLDPKAYQNAALP